MLILGGIVLFALGFFCGAIVVVLLVTTGGPPDNRAGYLD